MYSLANNDLRTSISASHILNDPLTASHVVVDLFQPAKVNPHSISRLDSLIPCFGD